MLLVILQMVNQANIEAETSHLLNIAQNDPVIQNLERMEKKDD